MSIKWATWKKWTSSMSQGLCALVSVPEACPLCHGACLHLFWLPRPAFCFTGLVCICFSCLGWPLHRAASVDLFWLSVPALCFAGFLCTCFISPPALFVTGLICSSFSCFIRVVCSAQVCMPSLSQHSGLALCVVRVVCAPVVFMLHHTQLPGLALCAASVVCAG